MASSTETNEHSLLAGSTNPAPTGTARLWIAASLVTLTLIAFWLRVRNLGSLGLIVDEGIQALSVQGILDGGLPLLPSGWVYSRGVTFTYLQALSAMLFSSPTEFALRLPAALLGAAVVPAAYWFARSVAGWRVGLLTATVLAFSVWEIELSRYGRFYTAFQLLFVVSLTCFYLGFIRGRMRYRIAYVPITVLAFTTHELAVMLIPLFAIPFLSPQTTRSEKRSLIMWGGGMAVLWFLQRRLTLLLESLHEHPQYIESSYTSSVEATKSMLRSQINVLLKVHTPDTHLFVDLVRQQPILAALLVVAAVSLVAWLAVRYWKDSWRATITALAVILTALFYQFGLAVIFLIAGLVLWADGWRWLWRPPLRAAYAFFAVALLFWSVWLTVAYPGVQQDVVLLFAGFPDFYGYFLQWYIVAWPIFLLLFARGAYLLLDQFLHDRSELTPIFIFCAIFIPVVLTSFLRWRYIESRYTFQFYPIMVTVFSMAVVDFGIYIQSRLSGSRIAAISVGAGVVVAALVLSQDANPYASWSVGSRTYADWRDPVKSVQNWEYYAYFHQDHKTPAAYIREHSTPDDEIIVFGPAYMSAVYAHYLGDIDYLLERYGTQEYVREDADGNQVSYISGSGVITTPQELADIINEPRDGAIWLLGDEMLLQPENHYFGEGIKAAIAQIRENLVYVGEDGVTFVVLIP